MDTKYVQLEKSFAGKLAGEKVEFDTDTAKSLVENGIAKEIEAPKSEIDGLISKALDERDARIVESISKEIAKSTVKVPANVSFVSEDKPEDSFWVAVGKTNSNNIYTKEQGRDLLANKFNIRQKDQPEMTAGTSSAGGYLVPVEYIERLLSVDGYEGVAYPGRVQIVPTTVRTVNLPSLDQSVSPSGLNSAFYGGVSITCVAEGQSPSDYTQPAFKQVTLTPGSKKFMALSQVSNELISMSPISVDALVESNFRKASIAHTDANILIGGGGATQFAGVVDNAATVSVPRGKANTIGLADLAKMWSVHKGVSNSAKKCWVMNPAAIGQLPIAGSPNHLVFLMDGAQTEFKLQLFGIPIVVSEALPALGSSGDVLLCDFDAYLVAIQREIRVEVSSHFGFGSDTTFYRLTYLMDGKPQLTAPITLLDGVTEVSPFVQLSGTVSS